MVLNLIDPTAAFDMVHDPVVALETLVSLGFQRVLTSGCDTSALEGLPLIKRLIDQVCLNYMYAFMSVQEMLWLFMCYFLLVLTQQAKGRISIMPGEYFCPYCVCILLMLFGNCPGVKCKRNRDNKVNRTSLASYLLIYFHTGGGITERNLQRILEGSGAQEFHCSARSSKDSAMKFRYVKIHSQLI